MSASRPYDFDRMRAVAERATGLRDTGPAGCWEDGARRLCAALSAESGLAGPGDFQVRTALLDLLSNRLRVHAALATMETKPSSAPLFVLGLPRTGTTLLHGALSRHPDLTAPTSVECFFPAGRSDDATVATRRVLDGWHRTVPSLRAIHAMEVDEPNECGFLLQHGFVTPYFGVIARVPSYMRWLDEARPLDEGYTLLARLYALLAARRPGGEARRWVLKCPHHLLALDALARAFPDARFVWMHRDVRDAVPSWCSLVAASRSRYAEVKPTELGPEELSLWARGVRRAEALRTTLGGRLLDVSYRRTVADLPGVFLDVCAFAGLPCDEALLANVCAWHTAHPRNRHGVHHYTAHDFGLTATRIVDSFEGYTGERDA